MNTDTRTKTFTRLGAGAGVLALTAALTLGAVTAASAQGAAPSAAGDSYAVAAGTVLTVSGANGLFANDSDPEGDPISIGQLFLNEVPMAGESLVTGADGSFVYTPPTGYTGTRVWMYRATDGTDQSPLAAIVFTISGPVAPPVVVNTPPVGGSDSYAVVKDSFLLAPAPGVFANDTDADGDTISFVSSGYQAVGMPGESLTVYPTGSFFYTPPTGYTGTRHVWYIISDGEAESQKIDVELVISAAATPGNAAPAAVPDVYSLVKNSTIMRPAATGFIANDTDADGDVLQFDNVQAPTGGYLPGESFDASTVYGAFTYIAPTGYVGDRVFTYTAKDGSELSNVSTITFHVTDVAPVNTAPVANADSYAVVKNTQFSQPAPGIFANDTDADGDTIAVANANVPSGGLLPGEAMFGSPDGSFVYTPPTGFVGDRVFSYRVFDGTDLSAFTTVTFTITADAPVNTAPVAVADSYLVVKDVLFARSAPGVLVNDSDADGDTITVDGWIYPAGGLLPGESLSGKLDGSFAYTPPTGFVGDRVFSYGIWDGTATADTTLTFQVRPRVSLDEPTIPTLPDGDPEDGTVPSTLASTGSTPSYALGTLAALIAAVGFVLVRSSRRVA